MSLLIDKQYANLISSKLEKFKWDNNKKTASFRCPICGDSAKSKNKTRGGFYTYNNSLMAGCFNCQHTFNNFGAFIKQIDPSLYKAYLLDTMRDKNGPKGRVVVHIQTDDNPLKYMEPKAANKTQDSPLNHIQSILELPPFHAAIKYIRHRKIPEKMYSKLFYTDNYKKWINDYVEPNKFEYTEGTDERLVIPFYNKDNIEFGYSGRYVGKDPNAKRYIHIKPNKENDLLYGMDRVDLNKPIYIVEGQIDSMFLENCLAASGSSLPSILRMKELKDSDLIFAFDNEPHSKEICSIMNKIITNGKSIVIWPKNLKEKDINDMFLAGLKPEEIIKNNNFKGLSAQLKFNEWKKV